MYVDQLSARTHLWDAFRDVMTILEEPFLPSEHWT
jgi:hypothetical protein